MRATEPVPGLLLAHLTHPAAGAPAPPVRKGALWAILKGRLDNGPELRDALSLGQEENIGDADLILTAYEKWGDACPERLAGDFSFVVWDGARERLFAARDPLGVCPLHYAVKGEWLLIASEARPLLAHPAISNECSDFGLMMWALNVYDDRVAMFADIQGLGPGERLRADRRSLAIEAYWPPANLRPLRYQRSEDYEAHFRELFTRCVADRRRGADGPVGVMMSGGLDSTSVAAAVGKGVALSYRFSRLADCDESPWIQAVSRHLDLPVHWFDADRQPLLEIGPGPNGFRENPFQSWDALHAEMIARLAGLGGRVILTGHGGDSLMTGLGPALLAASDESTSLPRRWLKTGAALRREGALGPRAMFRLLLAPRISDPWNRRLQRLLGRAPHRWPWIDRLAYAQLNARDRFFPWPERRFDAPARQRLYELLVVRAGGVRRAIHWLDRLAAPLAVVIRHPFLDRRLAEWALAAPPDRLRPEGQPKGLLRRAMSPLLPALTTERPSKPSLRSFYRAGIDAAAERLAPLVEKSELARRGLVDPVALAAALNDYLARDDPNADPLFLSTILTEIWLHSDVRAY